MKDYRPAANGHQPTTVVDVADVADPSGEGAPPGGWAPAEDQPEPVSQDRYGYLDWPDLWATDDTYRDWIIPDILPAGASCTLYAPGGVGKSLLALDWALGLATGGTVNGQPTTGVHVLYLDLEQDRSLVKERLEALGADETTDLSLLHYSLLGDWPPLDTAEGGRQLLAEAQRLGVALVVIDTASRVISAEENAADTWLAFNRHTGRVLKRHGIALLRLDHAGKDPTKGQRGSSAKEQDVDQIYKLEPVSGARVNLHRMKNRLHLDGPDLIPLVRESDPLRHRPTQVDNAREERISQILDILTAADAPATISRRDAATIVRTAGMKVRTQLVSEALRRRKLAAAGPWFPPPPYRGGGNGNHRPEPARGPQGTAGNQSGTAGDSDGNQSGEQVVPEGREPLFTHPEPPAQTTGGPF